jgi:hypothetical protein
LADFGEVGLHDILHILIGVIAIASLLGGYRSNALVLASVHGLMVVPLVFHAFLKQSTGKSKTVKQIIATSQSVHSSLLSKTIMLI